MIWKKESQQLIRLYYMKQSIFISQEVYIMKTVPFLNASTARETTTVLSSIKVCMHVLTTASDDPRVMRSATALVKAGCTVSLVDIADKGNHRSEEDIRGVCMKHVLVSGSFFSTRFDKRTLVRLTHLFVCSALRLIQTPADIYHAHDVSALPACYIAACLHHKPIIFDAHEMPLFERPLSELGRSRRWLHKLLGVLLAYIVPRCAGIITVSPPIAEEICSRYRVPEVTLIRNVPEYRAIPKSDRLRRYLGLKPEVRIALYQGNLQTNRGLDRLVRAAAFLEQNIAIVMMGKNRGTTQAQLEALIASEGVADRVRILPPVPHAELLDWTASADIGLNVASSDYSLNVRYFLPNKLFEYLMAGLPVLTSPLEAIVDVIKTYDVGQVMSSLAPADIGEAINRMLADPVGLARQRSNALEAARNEFYWEKERLQLIHLYQGILPRWGMEDKHSPSGISVSKGNKTF
jgi:glycosyltransferase involved in cell wall biosynthesis